MNLLVNAMIAKSDFRRKGICHKMNLQTEGHGRYGKCPPKAVNFREDCRGEYVTIPKSVRKERIEENFDIFDFRLTKEEITTIDLLDRNDAIADLTDVELIKKLNQLKVR